MAYNILYNLGKQATENVNKLMLQLSADDRLDVHIEHALKVRHLRTLTPPPAPLHCPTRHV